jgi:hypothetical protein
MKFVTNAVLFVLLLVACSEELSVEQQIIATLRNMEAAAEDGQHLEFMGYVTDTFDGQNSSMGRREFHRFMIFQINQKRRLQAQIFPVHVQESGDNQATADFKILVTGGAGLLPDSGQLFEVDTIWLNSGGEWLLEKANWVPVRLPDVPTLGE